MKRSRRTLSIVLKSLALLAVLLAAAWLYCDVSYGRQLDRELAKLRAAGAPLSLAEAAPKAPPPDQNAATLYMPIFRVSFDPQKPQYPAGQKGLQRFEIPDSFKAGDWASAEMLRPVLASLDCRQALAALREASLRPQCVFPVRWQDGPSALFPHLAALRSATRLCSARAMLEAKVGNMAGALDWLGVCYRMAGHAAQEPTLISQLSAIAMLGITNNTTQAIVDAGEVTPAVAAALRTDLDQLQLPAHFAHAMQGERALGLDCFRMIREGEPMLLELVGGVPFEAPGAKEKVLAGLEEPYWKLEEFNYLKYMGQVIERSQQPYRISQGQPVVPTGPGYILTGMLVPLFGKVNGKRDEALAGIDVLRTGLALKLLKHATGGYPATLDALGPTRATDIFTGRDFIYQRVRQGFKLYSVGINLRDDHGVGRQRHPAGDATDTDDIVWKCAR